MEKKIKELFLACGADVCGIGGISRFADAPEGHSPTDLFPDCRSVITFGKALPKGLLSVSSGLIYGHFNAMLCDVIDGIALDAAVALERDFHCRCVPLPSDGPYEEWDPQRMAGRGLLSMKHAAVLCGMGYLGKNTLFLHPQYGNRLVLGVVLTDLELNSDPLMTEDCPDNCGKCLRACPVQAIENGTVDQKKCRLNAYGKTSRGFDKVLCNQCRSVCPKRFGK